MYARAVELILQIPNVGLGLCHIGSPFKLNKYGQPYRDSNNQYPIDKNGKETVTWYKIPYLKNECDAVLKDRYIKLGAENIKTQFKLTL